MRGRLTGMVEGLQGITGKLLGLIDTRIILMVVILLKCGVQGADSSSVGPCPVKLKNKLAG